MQILLPNLKLKIAATEQAVQKQDYLLVAGGKQPDNILLNELAQNRIVYCADKGISYCRQAGIVPDYLFGDNDSALADDWLWAQANNVQIQQYPTDKNQTDLQITLVHILQQKNCRNLIVTGIWGGRFDHAYSAVLTLATYSKLLNCPIILIDQDEAMLVVEQKHTVTVDFLITPQVISLLPLEEQVQVTLQGTKWELTNALLTQDDPYAISNTLKDNSSTINLTVHTGQVGLYACFLPI